MLKTAKIKIRKNKEIYSFNGEWFKSRWHFSFDGYFDPENMGMGVVKSFNLDSIGVGSKWPISPYENVDGITYVYEGILEHIDEEGEIHLIKSGGVLRLKIAGTSEHYERNASENKAVQFYRIWLKHSEDKLIPSVKTMQTLKINRRDKWLQLIKPIGDKGRGLEVNQDIHLFVSNLSIGKKLEFDFQEKRCGYLHLIKGKIKLNDENLSVGDSAKILSSGSIRIIALDPSEIIMFETYSDKK